MFPFTTRSPRLTRVSEGKPFLRLLVASKPEVVEVFGFVFHDTPPFEKTPVKGRRIIASNLWSWRGADGRVAALRLTSGISGRPLLDAVPPWVLVHRLLLPQNGSLMTTGLAFGMKCAQCRVENAPGATFCVQCGVRLVASCPSCGASALPTQRFCGACGTYLDQRAAVPAASHAQNRLPRHLAEKILTSRASLEGERKQVTVLFADIKGSLELLADRDPEEAGKLLDAVLDRMMEGVHRYEGTVSQAMGDGIMAIFGAPVAHEDHAVRACYAALRARGRIMEYAEEIMRTEGLSLQVRIGMNSGEVVVRAIGSDLHMDYTAIGLTTHLAARMEQIAAPGSILITGDTLRLCEGYVDVKALGAVPIKGLPSRVDIYEVVGAGPVRSRLQAAAARGLTRFVGRSDEMTVLQEALGRANAGKLEVVAIVGEAGVGKSRLVHEFIHSGHTRGWLVVESNSVSYGRATPYLPAIDFLKNYFKIDARDETRTIREKVTGKMLTLEPALQNAIPPVFDLLEALPGDHAFRSLDPFQRREQTTRAITRLIREECRVQPMIVVFEDLHWNDELTVGMLNGLINSLGDSRLLLLVSYRPEYRDEWAQRTDHRKLRLEPLPSASIEELLATLLGSDADLSAMKAFLIERTGGNPFFLEESVRTLVETQVLSGSRGEYRLAKPFTSVQVPATVQAVLASRIDRLPSEHKRVLQEAAVIGKDFAFTLLQAVTGVPEDELQRQLSALQSAEFFYATGLFPDLEYTFKHSLTHEVALGELVHERRRDIHARIVDAVEKLYAGRLTEQVERLADHALNGELWLKALTYLRQAGAKAADRPAYREAFGLFKQALEVLQRLPESRDTREAAVDVRFAIRNALQPLGDHDEISIYLREAERLVASLDDPRREGWVHSYLTDHFWMLGRTQEAAAAGERALEIARKLSDLPLQVVTNLPLGLLYHTQGDYRRAIEYLEWNITHLEGSLKHERFGLFVLPSSFSRAFTAWALAELGEFDRGLAIGNEGVRLAEEADHPFSRGYAYLGTGVVYLRKGDLTHAIPAFERALAGGAFADIPVGFAYVAFHLGYALALAGRSSEGVAMLERTVQLAEEKHFVARHALRLAYLGEAYLLAGLTSEAAAVAAKALRHAREHGERANEAYVLRVVGDLEIRNGEHERAAAHYRDALDLSRELKMRPLQAQCHWGMAYTSKIGGDSATATRHQESAEALLRSMDMRLWRESFEGGGAIPAPG